MIVLIEGELVDTYGGDFTYRNVWYEIIDGKYRFYENYYGAKSSPLEEITDVPELDLLTQSIDKL